MRALLAGSGKEGAILFVSAHEPTKATLHVGGAWLSLRSIGQGRWNIDGIAAPMSAIYAGGTDMLARMVRYILADPSATVPVAVGASWMADVAEVGQVGGQIAGMEALELKGDPRIYLYIASSRGDRLFRARRARRRSMMSRPNADSKAAHASSRGLISEATTGRR